MNRSEIRGDDRLPGSIPNTSHMRALICSILTVSTMTTGCARNHTYIEPNGQITSISHQPFFGAKKYSADTVQMAAVPTEVQGAKVISVSPAPAQSAQVGVVNPAIPEAVVVQPPAVQGAVAEPALINSGLENNGTQISGGIRKSTGSGGEIQQGLLD